MKHVKPDEPRADVVYVSQCSGGFIYIAIQGKSGHVYQLHRLSDPSYIWKDVTSVLSTVIPSTKTVTFPSLSDALLHAIGDGFTVLEFRSPREYGLWLSEFYK